MRTVIILLYVFYSLLGLNIGPVMGGDDEGDLTVEVQVAQHPEQMSIDGEAPQAESDPGEDSVGEEDIEETEEVKDVSAVPAWDSEAHPRIERVVNVMTARTTRGKAFFFAVNHRTWQPLGDDTFSDLLGFDSGNLKIGLELRYGILDNLEVGVLRLNGTTAKFKTDTYDFDAKYQLLHQDRHYLDFAVRGGITWFAVEDDDDEAGFFGQFLVNHTVHNRLRLGTGLLYHSDSYNEGKGKLDDDHSLAIPFTAEFRLTRLFALNGEIVPNVAGYGGDDPVFSASFKIITHKHTFAIVFSNTQYIGPAGIAANTNRELEDLIIGFTITRVLPL